LIINCTHEHILRLLPPFIIREKDVTEFLERFEKTLTRMPKSELKPFPASTSDEMQSQPMVLAATR
jgi:hypothetical protein